MNNGTSVCRHRWEEALSVPVTSPYPEHIDWHETRWPHLTHHQQPPISLRGHWNPWNPEPSKFPRQMIINNWIPEEMGPSINLHYCAGFGPQLTVTDHARSIITIRGKQLLVLFCPPPNPRHPEEKAHVTPTSVNVLPVIPLSSYHCRCWNIKKTSME